MNTITILLPTYNREKECLTTIWQLVSAIDLFIESSVAQSLIELVCSENNSTRLQTKLPIRSYLRYTSTSSLLSMSQNIANALLYSSPGFFWIVPDDDIIDIQQFVFTLSFLFKSTADLVNIGYSTLSNPKLRICKEPFFLISELKCFQPPFMLLSSLAFKLSSHQEISHFIELLESTDNTFAQNFLFSVLPSYKKLTICSLNTVPVIYNDLANPRFFSAKAAFDATSIVSTLSYKYNINCGYSERLILRHIMYNSIKNIFRIFLLKPVYFYRQRSFFLRDMRLLFNASLSQRFFHLIIICFFPAFLSLFLSSP